MKLKRSVQATIVASLMGLITALALPAIADRPDPTPPDYNTAPTAVEHCNDGGWALFEEPSFAHQGDCVSWVLTEEEAGHQPEESEESGSELVAGCACAHPGADGQITITVNGSYVHVYSISIDPCTGDVSGSGYVGTIQETLSGAYADGKMQIHSDYDTGYWWEFEADIDIATGHISAVRPITSSLGQYNMRATWTTDSWTAVACPDADGDGIWDGADPCPTSALNDGDLDGICDTPAPTSDDECRNGGWESFNNPTFRNQGDCVSYVATDGENPAVVDGDDSANSDRDDADSGDGEGEGGEGSVENNNGHGEGHDEGQHPEGGAEPADEGNDVD